MILGQEGDGQEGDYENDTMNTEELQMISSSSGEYFNYTVDQTIYT